MKRAIMAIMTVWILVSSMFFVLTFFTNIENVHAPYVPHDPIRINNNTEFASMAGMEGWTGNGLPGNPYLIEGYDINGNGYGYCIYIGNTTVYFQVMDCYLHDASGGFGSMYHSNSGIILYIVQNGTLTNNTSSWNYKDGINIYSSSSNKFAHNNASWNYDYGIYLFSSSNNTIAHNTVSSNSADGIILASSNSNTLTNNTVLDNDNGIFTALSNNNTITNNNASNNFEGIYLSNSDSNTIINNTASTNTHYGISFDSSNYNAITNNTVPNNYYGIVLGGSSNNIVTNNTASSNNVSSIYLSFSNSNTVVNNTASNNEHHGIRLGHSNSNTIVNNTALFNYNYGIYVYESHNNNIVNNNASSNTWSGIYLKTSNTNTIGNNNVSSNNYEGIRLDDSNINTITDNTILFSNWSGIYLKSSSNQTIKNNTISSNNVYGIWIIDAGSLDNKIYHNNIIKNANQAYDETNDGNQWDNGYPSGGNFWWDYTGNDYYSGPNQDQPGSDGIGDVNYSIDSDSVDNYPLVSPTGHYIFLYPGWNLVSIPFIQYETNLCSVLSLINGSYDAVQWFNSSDSSDPWKHHHNSKPSHLNDLTNIEHTNGFWIHITQPGGVLFEYSGTPPTSNQSIPLHPGWNMVGYPSLFNRNRTAALNNITFGVEVDSIWTFTAVNQTWKEIDSRDIFEVGRGYWVHVRQECIWEVGI